MSALAGDPLADAGPLVDVHVHLGRSDVASLFYPELTLDEYEALAGAAGVALACAFAPFREGGYEAANRALLSGIADSGARVRAFARLGGRHLPLTHREPWALRRKAAMAVRGRAPDLGDPSELDVFAGVKLLPHLDGLPGRAEFERIAALELPVLIHAGRHCPPRWIERTVLPRTRGPVILAHLGAFPCEDRLLADAVDVAARQPRAFLDTSGAWLARYIAYAAERVPDKLLFGSDAPLAHPLVAWRHVASAVADERTRERIARGNAASIGLAAPGVEAS